MRCDKCRNEALFFQSYSGRHLCGRHLALDIEARAKRTIRSHRWMSPGDHIGIVISGDRKSAVLLYFLKNLTADRRDIRLSALFSGVPHARTGCRPTSVTIAESLGIPVVEMPPASAAMAARPDRVTRIAFPISLEDIAERVLGQFLFGEADRFINPHRDRGNPVPVICPFMTIPSEELDIYGEIGIPGTGLPMSIPDHDSAPQEIRALLDGFTRSHPATKYALMHLAEQLSGGNAALTVVPPDIADP